MNREARSLLYRAVISVMVGDGVSAKVLYERYVKAARLHATIEEILEYKKELRRAG